MLRTLSKHLSLLLLLAFTVAATGADYEVVHELGADTPPGNIAISPKGRVFISTHFFYGDQPHKVVEVLENGSTVPYPNPEFSASLNPVLGVIADANGLLWLLETADADTRTGRLIAWDTINNKLSKVIYIPASHLPANSFLNDLAVDLSNQAVYITDTASPDTSALFVVDLTTGEIRRVLEGSPFTRPEDQPMLIDGKEVKLGAEGARIGVNPITIDAQDNWVYFAPMTGQSLFRVQTQHLLDKQLTSEQLAAKVERYADKPFSDGITIDNQNNVYITDITHSAVGVITTNREYRILHQSDEQLSWPDGFANGTQNQIYATINKLHKSPTLNAGKDDSGGRYYLVRFKALADVSIGR